MQVVANLKKLRVAPRKTRAVANLLKGQDALSAQHQLRFWAKKSAGPLAKLLHSALSNAENNFGLVKENLFIKEIAVDEGFKIKRSRPTAMGRTSPIEKKTSHIRIVLEEKVPGMKINKHELEKKRKAEKEAGAKATSPDAAPSASVTSGPDKPKTSFSIKREESKKEINKKGVISDIKSMSRRFFRRKSI